MTALYWSFWEGSLAAQEDEGPLGSTQETSLSDEGLEAKLSGNEPVRAKDVRQRPQPDWNAIHQQFQRHRHLTLQSA